LFQPVRSGDVSRISLLALVCTFGLAWPLAVLAAPPGDPLQAAVQWLQPQQQPDGGFSNGFTPSSDASTTADAVTAVRAAGSDPASWKVAGHSPLDYLASAVAAGDLKGPGVAAKVTLAAVASGLDPHDFGGADLVTEILGGYDTSKGLFGGGPFDSALCIQALLAVKAPLPGGAIQGLVGTRLADGSYSFNGDTKPGSGDSNTTAAVVMALAEAGAKDQIKPSLDYFRAAQNDDAGWTYQKPSPFGEATDANSTALVIQALVAAGENLQNWKDPRQALLALQQTNGAFVFNAATPGDNLLATVQAIPALAVTELSSAASGSPVSTPLVVAVLVILVVILAGVAWFARRAG
jgi:hypothetical protein